MTFIGDKLRLGRVARGLSLEDLAKPVKVTRQHIHQLETGVRTPAIDVQAALAETLGVSKLFFEVPLKSTVTAEECHFRKQVTTPRSVTSQVLARGALLDDLASELDSTLKLPKVNFPAITVNTEDDIEKAAQKCREQWGLGDSGPITSMTRVVENAGAIVTQFDGVSEKVDALSMDRRRPIIVRNTVKESLSRQRFDLAHECGHLVMHQGVATGDQITEGQANRFASALLLPRASFIKEFPRGKSLDWKVIFELKLRWKVAARAIIRRAYDLGIIGPTQYRTANIHLVKTGQAKQEKYDDELPLERPELLDAAFNALEKRHAGSAYSLVTGLGLDSGMFPLITGMPLPSMPQMSGNVVSLFSK